MYARYSERLLKELLQEFRILYLTGPRQAGKTTLARKILYRSFRVDVYCQTHLPLR